MASMQSTMDRLPETAGSPTSRIVKPKSSFVQNRELSHDLASGLSMADSNHAEIVTIAGAHSRATMAGASGGDATMAAASGGDATMAAASGGDATMAAASGGDATMAGASGGDATMAGASGGDATMAGASGGDATMAGASGGDHTMAGASNGDATMAPIKYCMQYSILGLLLETSCERCSTKSILEKMLQNSCRNCAGTDNAGRFMGTRNKGAGNSYIECLLESPHLASIMNNLRQFTESFHTVQADASRSQFVTSQRAEHADASRSDQFVTSQSADNSNLRGQHGVILETTSHPGLSQMVSPPRSAAQRNSAQPLASFARMPTALQQPCTSPASQRQPPAQSSAGQILPASAYQMRQPESSAAQIPESACASQRQPPASPSAAQILPVSASACQRQPSAPPITKMPSDSASVAQRWQTKSPSASHDSDHASTTAAALHDSGDYAAASAAAPVPVAAPASGQAAAAPEPDSENPSGHDAVKAAASPVPVPTPASNKAAAPPEPDSEAASGSHDSDHCSAALPPASGHDAAEEAAAAAAAAPASSKAGAAPEPDSEAASGFGTAAELPPASERQVAASYPETLPPATQPPAPDTQDVKPKPRAEDELPGSGEKQSQKTSEKLDMRESEQLKSKTRASLPMETDEISSEGGKSAQTGEGFESTGAVGGKEPKDKGKPRRGSLETAKNEIERKDKPDGKGKMGKTASKGKGAKRN